MMRAAAVFVGLALSGVAACSSPTSRGQALLYECVMCKTHRDAPGVCCGSLARACRFACSCGRHSDVAARCCGTDMPPARPGRCVGCDRAGIAGMSCCGGRMR
ncbi:MAG: hypothetical protein HYY16_00105 [Planctomycetes bacterium]|nr:hypothetical protein [Planctomycetota bacterium]